MLAAVSILNTRELNGNFHNYLKFAKIKGVKISATIIVHNEESNIAAVCESVSWADEIVIVDSYSSDTTVEIARAYTDKIFNRDFVGFKDKHQYADSLTNGDWIFWIDADERVTAELRSAIDQLRENGPERGVEGYRIARRTFFLGRWIKHSGWYPDFQMRLYQKDKSYWDGIAPHETARVNGRVETLSGELLHYTKQDLDEYHRVLGSYASLSAEYHVKKGKIAGAFDLLFKPIFAFLRTYLLKQGFRDGVPGLMIAIFTTYGVFLRYAKVWELNKAEK